VRVTRTRAELATALTSARGEGGTVGLVPTMGYLHDGHLSLVDRARADAGTVVVSIFVNPLQFGPSEDLSTYPRDEERDLALLADRGTDLVFAPAAAEMYPGGAPSVRITPGPMGQRLCGAFRPGHFEGVLTVVAKLFGLVRPDLAIFGRKDYQQAVLIQRMATDLDMGVRIETAPILREPDGVALSSRNAYLSAAEREQASGLHAALATAAARYADGERAPESVLGAARARLAAHPLLRLQYLEAVHPETLEPAPRLASGTVVAAAVFCGATRLIDNVELP